MIVKEVYLKNFISYNDVHVEFPLGVTVIVGENGAGKTALLDGITYALFKEHGRGKDENLIKRQSNNASTKLKFSIRGKDYEVEWRLSRGRPAVGSLKNIDEGIPLVRPDSGERTIVPEIMKLTGLDKRVFLNAIYVKQGEIARLLDVQPHERKEVVGQLLGVGELDNIWRVMRGPIDILEEERKRLKGECEKLSEKQETLQKIIDELLSMEAELEEQNKRLSEVDYKIKDVKSMLDELEEKARRFNDLKTDIIRLDGEIREKKAKQDSMSSQLKQLESARKVLQECEGYYKECEWIRKDLRKLKDEKGRVEKEIEAMKSIQNDVEKKKARVQMIEEGINRELERFREIAGHSLDANGLSVYYPRICQHLETTYQDLENKYLELQDILIDKMYLKERYKLLKAVSGIAGAVVTILLIILLLVTPIAPLPLSTLPLIIAIPVRILLSRREKIFESEIENIQKKIQELNENMKNVDEKKIKLQGIDVRAIEERIQEVKKVSGEIKKLEVELQSLKELQDNHDKLTNMISKYEERLRELEPYVTRYIEAEGVLKQVSIKDLENLEEKIKQLDQTISELVNEVEGMEGILKKLNEEINLLQYDEQEHSLKKIEYENLRNEKSEIEKEIVRLEEKIKSLQEQKRTIEEEINKLRSLQEEYDKLNRYVNSLEKIRDRIFHKDALQKVIRKHASALVEESAKRFLREFNLPFYDINIDEDFNIIIHGPAGEQTLEMLSGGEKIAVALVLRLSIAASLVGEALKCIIMDEPTIHLDSERRRELVNLLKDFKGGVRLIPQVIIVSHDRELEEAADRVYEVVRSEGTSKIRQLY